VVFWARECGKDLKKDAFLAIFKQVGIGKSDWG
jgi:hypothetical protein